MTSVENSDQGAMMQAIAHALRKAAGLPDEDDPYVWSSNEAHLPDLKIVASLVVLSSVGPPWKNPRAAEEELETTRRDLRRFKDQISSLDWRTVLHINQVASPKSQAAETARKEYEATLPEWSLMQIANEKSKTHQRK